ncbi:class I SAM-dependent methyltransferase [Planosporangium thailandense]|uniref:Class I SAM-dependent methyltransferase n=1 Tax=Planosporangium thailandense TaxID=765197 RepID=A0ABX0XSW6_9ACTN|nr:class I SAM-dependent methyltransferase [Planosporangium thailandense]NJC68545.1 class I SAM-dependent methyltransferase [Planosporangium thailandense]
MSTPSRDWYAWHAPYDEPGSPRHRRLRIVQGHIRAWLGERAGRSPRVVSACAGQGRDLIEVLAGAPDGAAVRARLIELDRRNVDVARRTARDAGLAGVEVVCADAGLTDAYVGAVPADLVLMCGVFGNISDGDVRRTVGHLPQLCAPDATVIWTRTRRSPDLTPAIRSWLRLARFVERSFDAPADALFSVGVHRFAGAPQPVAPGRRMFEFVT